MSTVTLPAETPPVALAAEPEIPPAAVLRPPSIALGIGIIATILVIASLYLARSFFVPLLIGILASYTLTPLVDLLRSWHIPRALGAALVLGTIAGLLGWGTFALGDDATALVARLPEAAQKVREEVRASRASGPSSLQRIQEAATTLEDAAADASERPPGKTPAARPARKDTAPSSWLQEAVFAQGALLANVLAQAPLV